MVPQGVGAPLDESTSYPIHLNTRSLEKEEKRKREREMNKLKSALVVLALLASLVGGYLIGVSAPQVRSALPVLHQPALHQLLATGGSGGGGDPGSEWPCSFCS